MLILRIRKFINQYAIVWKDNREVAKLFYTMFPFFEMAGANKKLIARVKEIEKGENLEQNIQYMKCYQQLPLSEIETFYEKTLNVKKSLEEKLKVSLLSVTVGITLLTSMIGFLYQDGFSELNSYIRAITFFVATLSITFMIFSAVYAIKTISGKITVYQLFPEDLADATTEDEKKESIAICAELNSLMNIIRQNLMSVSYHCIVNSLVLVAILFFTLGVSSFYVNHKDKSFERIRIEIDIEQKKLISIQSDLSSFKTNMTAHQASISSSMQDINNSIIDNTQYSKELEVRISETKSELCALKNEIAKRSNNANTADAKNGAAD